MTVIERLADAVAGCSAADLPSRVLDRALLSTLDTLAAAAGGVNTLNAVAARRSAFAIFGQGNVPLWFGMGSTRLGGALLANCAAASALDVDDGHRGAAGHPGAAIVPAVLSAATVADWDGSRVLCAIVLGYEVALRVAAARRIETWPSYASGRWCGFGVAAALGWLHCLGVDELAQALAIAGAESPQSLPQGASRGMGMVKGSSPWATLTALGAVERARAGGTGPVDMLDLDLLYDSARITPDWGARWRIEETYLKPYASCRYTHAAIDAVLTIASQVPFGVDDIDGLSVATFPEADRIPNDRRPTTVEAAQFSIPFCVALAALRGRDALQPLRESSLEDGAILALSDRLELSFGNEFTGAFPERTPARVTVAIRGRQYSHTVQHPLGDVANPLGRADVESKLRALARGNVADDAVDRIIVEAGRLQWGSALPLLDTLAGRAMSKL